MRKCHMCGYLVLGDGETCKNCGALLPRVSALVASGAPPVPPAATPITPAPPPAPAAPPAPIGAAPHAARHAAPYAAPPPAPGSHSAPPSYDGAPGFAREWDAPSPVPVKAPRHNTPRVVLAFVVIASMALGWVGMGQFLKNDHVPAGTKDFVAGHGVSYSSPDHTFEAKFPSQPTLVQKQFPVAASMSTLNLAQAQTDDYEVVAASMVVPVRVPDSQVDTAIHQILDAGAAAQDAKIVSEKKVTIEGAPGIEVHAKIKDGYDARLLVIVSGSRFYLLGVHATSGVDRLYDALIASLIIY